MPYVTKRSMYTFLKNLYEKLGSPCEAEAILETQGLINAKLLSNLFDLETKITEHGEIHIDFKDPGKINIEKIRTILQKCPGSTIGLDFKYNMTELCVNVYEDVIDIGSDKNEFPPELRKYIKTDD
jgi:hypothetical protein